LGSGKIVEHLATAAGTFVAFLELFLHNVDDGCVYQVSFASLLVEPHAYGNLVEACRDLVVLTFGRADPPLLPNVIDAAGSGLQLRI